MKKVLDRLFLSSFYISEPESFCGKIVGMSEREREPRGRESIPSEIGTTNRRSNLAPMAENMQLSLLFVLLGSAGPTLGIHGGEHRGARHSEPVEYGRTPRGRNVNEFVQLAVAVAPGVGVILAGIALRKWRNRLSQ